MSENLSLGRMLAELRKRMESFPDSRTGKNKVYSMAEGGMAAFSVFFMQNPSFLAYQQAMQDSKGRNNARTLFGLSSIPSDNEIRSLLDGVRPEALRGIYGWVLDELEQGGVLEGMRSYEQQLLIALDGTWYFRSKKIQCASCNTQELSDGSRLYYHSLITPVLVAPGRSEVISLEPEFILPQDGHEKQDCEMAAAKRWISEQGPRYSALGTTILGDDLYSKQPFCELLLAGHFHFILVCKKESHPQLAETLDFFEKQGVLHSLTKRRWKGKRAEIATYRFANQVALRGGSDALLVNWCEISVTSEDTGEPLYHNSFITDFPLSEASVEAVVRDGRARWKVENENNNVLKNKGYHLEHNFGHGDQFLASLLLSLNLLAFLFHSALDLVDARYRQIRLKLASRKKLFHDLDALTRYMIFDTWDQLFDFMFHGLELDTS